MTREELEALPENGGIDMAPASSLASRLPITAPYVRPSLALFQGPDDIMIFEDSHGHFWTTGWANGVLYKSRLSL